MKNKKNIFSVVAVLTIVCMFVVVPFFTSNMVSSQERSAEEIGRDIMERVQNQPTPQLSESTTDMKIVRTYGSNKEKVKEEVKTFKTYTKKFGEEHSRALVEFIRPSNIKVLRWSHENGEDDIWVKASSGTPKKLNSTGDKQDSFQGAHFTYEDMEERNLDDYEFKYMGKEKISIKRDGKKPIKLETFKIAARKIKGEDSAYSYAYFYVMPKKFILMRADLYDKNKKLDKQMEVLRFDSYKGYKDSYNIITHVRMRLAQEKNQYTEIKINSIKVDSQAEKNIYDSIFNSENM